MRGVPCLTLALPGPTGAKLSCARAHPLPQRLYLQEAQAGRGTHLQLRRLLLHPRRQPCPLRRLSHRRVAGQGLHNSVVGRAAATDCSGPSFSPLAQQFQPGWAVVHATPHRAAPFLHGPPTFRHSPPYWDPSTLPSSVAAHAPCISSPWPARAALPPLPPAQAGPPAASRPRPPRASPCAPPPAPRARSGSRTRAAGCSSRQSGRPRGRRLGSEAQHNVQVSTARHSSARR